VPVETPVQTRRRGGKAYVTANVGEVVASLLGEARMKTLAKQLGVSFNFLSATYRAHTTPEQRNEAKYRKKLSHPAMVKSLFAPGHKPLMRRIARVRVVPESEPPVIVPKSKEDSAVREFARQRVRDFIRSLDRECTEVDV
jgi:hypothetical protein